MSLVIVDGDDSQTAQNSGVLLILFLSSIFAPEPIKTGISEKGLREVERIQLPSFFYSSIFSCLLIVTRLLRLHVLWSKKWSAYLQSRMPLFLGAKCSEELTMILCLSARDTEVYPLCLVSNTRLGLGPFLV